MFTSKPRSINGLLLLAAVVGLVFGSAGPAAASHHTVQGGSSDDYGEEWGPATDQLCSADNQFTGAHFETTYYLITNTPFTFVIRDNGFPVVQYDGTVTMNIQHGEMVSAPQGAAPGDCPVGILVPAAVPLTKATVLGNSSGSSGAGSVNCQPRDTTPGTYERIDDDFEFNFNLSCTVKGNTSGLTASRYVWTTFTMSGTQNTSGYLRANSTGIAVSGNGH